MITVNINIPNESPFVLTQNNFIKGFTMLYECDSDISKLYAPISANELSLSLINKDSVFSLENTESPLFNKLGNGTELEVFEVLSGEPISRGKFYIVDYSAPLSAMTSTFSIRAVDRLQAVLNKDVSLEQIEYNLNLYDYFFKIFTSLGFSSDDLLIDEALKSIILNFSVMNGQKMAQILNSCCLASDCMIFVDSKGRIQIKEKNMIGTPVKHFTTNNIISLNVAKSLSFDNNMLKFGYVSAELSEVQELLKVSLECKPGESTNENISFSKNNVFEVDNIKVESTYDVVIEECDLSQATISIKTYNPFAESEIVNVVVMGKTIETTKAYIINKNEDDIVKNGEKSMELSSDSVQNKDLATTISTIYWDRLNEKTPYLTLKTRSNTLQFEPCMIVDVIEPTRAKLNYLGYIHSIKYVWNGEGAFSVELGIKSAKGVEVNE